MNLRLDGRTAVLGVIGDPVAQVKAPQPLTTLLQSRERNAVVVPLHVHADDVEHVLHALLRVGNFVGLIVTVPHKQRIAALEIDALPAARSAGAVNVLRNIKGQWQADLLDGLGFVDNLRAHDVKPRGLHVAIAGAGGAAHAIAFALAAAGAASIAIHDVDPMRQSALIARLGAAGCTAHVWDGRSAGAQLLVNATPMGMRPEDPLPIAAGAISAHTVVADVVMEPDVPALLEVARSRGAIAVTGRGMMECQLQRMADFFAEAIRQ